MVESPWRNTRRYLPPTRASISQDSSVSPSDWGTHHCLNSSALANASNTSRAGALMVRVTTISLSEARSTVVRFAGAGSGFLLASMDLLLAFQFLDYLLKRVEARLPELAVALQPGSLLLEAPRPEPAGPHAPDLLSGDEPGLLQHADVLLHAGQRHVEPVGEVRDRGVGTPELLEHAAPGDVRQRGECVVEAGLRILNHMVQYATVSRGVQGLD